MLTAVSSVFSFVFSQFNAIWLVYTAGAILPCFFTLWILDRVFNIFQILKR